MSCQICTETFNKSTNSIVTCPHCSEEACKNCVRTYILGFDDEAQCMFCKSPQDIIFLASSLNKTWVHTTYKKHREKILLDKQIAQLPATQDKARKTKTARELKNKIAFLNEQKKELIKTLKEVNNKIQDYTSSVNILLNSTSDKSTSSFTFKCPHPDCSGFLDKSWLCGLCNNKTCKDCMEIIEEGHKCDSEKLESVKMIRKDTKPCPGCGEFIHKIHGCDQMWCPTCKVAFSWRTGQVEKGTIHNPEYYRWMRENNEEIPRMRNNNDCGQIPDVGFLLVSLRKIWMPTSSSGRLIDDLYVHKIYNCHRLIQHVTYLEQSYRRETITMDSKLENLRVKYLLNEITKEFWMVKIQTQDKAFKKFTDIINIWRLFRDTALDILWYTAEQFHKSYNINELKNLFIKNVFPKLDKIRNFCNTSFENTGKLYCSDYEVITQLFTNMSYKSYKRNITNN